MSVNSMHRTLTVVLCQDAKEAIDAGHVYREPTFKPIEVKKVVVVRNGTENGNPTVDFVLQDDTGQQFVFMVTGNLLKSIPC